MAGSLHRVELDESTGEVLRSDLLAAEGVSADPAEAETGQTGCSLVGLSLLEAGGSIGASGSWVLGSYSARRTRMCWWTMLGTKACG